MRITFVCPALNVSGGIKVVSIYAALLSARGHKVCVVAPSMRPAPIGEKLKQLVRGRGWPAAQPRARDLYFDETKIELRILKKSRPVTMEDVPDADAIIATWWETAEWVNGMGASKGVKVYFIQGHEVFPHLPVERCRSTYRMPFHKIVVAPWLREVMQDEYGDGNAVVIPNSVDRNQFCASPRSKQLAPTIGFLYHPAALKGIECVLSAIEQIIRRLPDLRVVSFGARAPSSPLPSYVEFICDPLQNEIRNIYSRCDVWMTASRTEGFNLPALEAMACRTPVVSTRTGWPAASIQNGYNGFLVEIDDVQALAHYAETVLTLPSEDWKTISNNAYSTSNKGSWDESAEQFEAALHNFQSKTGQGPIR